MAMITEETISAYLKSPVRYIWWREANHMRGGKTGYVTDRKMEKVGFFFLTSFPRVFSV